MPTTADTPKCFADVEGRRILDWIVDAFRQNDIQDVCFIGGYRIETVQEQYPGLVYRHNADWPRNNILASLLCAEDLMDGPFICCYSDILFTPQIVADLLASDDDMALGVDTEWLVRYEKRSEHPSDDAEKVTVDQRRTSRGCTDRFPSASPMASTSAWPNFRPPAPPPCEATTTFGAISTRGDRTGEAQVFEKAYLIHLLQDLIESGQRISHVDTPGGYIEIGHTTGTSNTREQIGLRDICRARMAAH